MAFWGVEIKSGRPFTLLSASQNGRLHISQATLGDGSSPKKTVLQCNVGNNAPVILCSLLPDKFESFSLNLEFEEEEDVVFSVLGPRSIHLCGYHISSGHTHDENDSDSYGEDIDIESEADEESNYYDSEDEYDDDFIDDNDVLACDTPSKHVSGVKIEEIIDDEQLIKVNDGSKLGKHQPCSNAERKFLTLEGSDSEDEDGLPVSTGRRKKHSKVVEDNENLYEQLGDENVGEKPTDDQKFHCAGSKRKSDALPQDKNQNKEKNPSKSGLENNRKPKKKKKKGMMNEGPVSEADMSINHASNSASNAEDQSGQKHGADDGEHGNSAVLKSAANCGFVEVEEVKKKKKKKEKKKTEKKKTEKNNAETDRNLESDQSKLATSGKKRELEEVPLEEDRADMPPIKGARTFPNGMVIEETCMGKPDGKRASPGMKVSVHYIGKLKKNGSIFDSSVGRKPFKFRLGIGEVIKGWEVGINGMRVGDKRRLTIPPSMGYGSTGLGKIPGNAWLVFDVELVNVH